MNNINTEYVHFEVYNFTGAQALSSYTLRDTPLTFIANISALPAQYANDQILWSFGDSTFDTSLTGVHVYDQPGVYTATCWVYDLSGNSYQSSFSTDVTIQDFVEDRVYFSVSSNITLTSGQINQPISIIRSNSGRDSINSTISLGSSGGSLSFFELGLDTNKYGHLLPYSTFYKLVSSETSTEFVEIDSIDTRNNTTLFCIVSNNTISFCNSSVIGSIFCGTSGYDYVYFKDDTPTPTVNLYCWFDGRNSNINTSVCGISGSVVQNNDHDSLSITSTGIDGEGSRSYIYNIDKTAFVNEKIYFVVKIKDSSWYSVKYPSIFTLSSAFSCVLIDNSGNILPSKLENNFTIYNTVSTGGYFKGTIVPLVESASTRISAFGVGLEGQSSTFTVSPSTGHYNISKKNENFDWTQTMKDICFQEVLIDSNVLFDDFIGSIFGGLSGSPSGPGKLPYEKIANFVDNNQTIDYCNIDKFYSICSALGYDIKDTRANVNYPPQIKRLVDLFSIKFEKLVGTTNKFDENFNRLGDYDIDVYGTNIGIELDLMTHILTGGDNFIVAQEKFSGEFTKCNTYLLSSGASYPLSSYSPDWGWNLVLGTQVSGADIGRYYTFYSFVSSNETTPVNSIFDYTNPLHHTSISYTNWEESGGIIDDMLIYQFLSNTNIISSY